VMASTLLCETGAADVSWHNTAASGQQSFGDLAFGENVPKAVDEQGISGLLIQSQESMAKDTSTQIMYVVAQDGSTMTIPIEDYAGNPDLYAQTVSSWLEGHGQLPSDNPPPVPDKGGLSK
jgi:hypothetical protein